MVGGAHPTGAAMSKVKLKHRFWGAIRILSLLLCAGFLLMGVRSCSTTDLIRVTTAERHYEVVTIPWSVRVTVARAWTEPRPMEWQISDENGFLPADLGVPIFGQRPIYRTWYYFGMGIKRDSMPILASGGRRTVTYTILTMPFQTLAFIAFLPVTWRILTRRRRRKIREFRIAHGQCANCGYDMRFSGERCPECGWKIPAAPTSEAVT
jgi:hypothetical protein